MDRIALKRGLWLMVADGEKALFMKNEGDTTYPDFQIMREMEQEMKNMPPEQRRQMEAMLKQHGVGLGSPGTVKTCLTKEDLARNDWQSPQHQGNCRTTSSTRTGNTWKFHTSCPAPDATEIDGEVTFVSPDRYTMKSAVTTTEDGQKKTRRMTATSTWLGADCGGIKPSGRSQTK